MILFLKHAAITIAILVGFLAALLGAVGFVSQGMSDNPHDDTGRLVSFSSFCVAGICVLLIFLLSGCAEVRTLYHACRNGLCS